VFGFPIPRNHDTMTEIAILTPDPADATYAGHWELVLQRLREALVQEGFAATPVPWTAHVDDAEDLRRYARVLPLLAWGYHLDAARWLRACATWEQGGVAMANLARVLAWNSDKRYLRELAQAGVRIPPTTFTGHLDQAQVDAVFDACDCAAVIVKPAISGGAWQTLRLQRGEALPAGAGAGAPMLVQPYLPTIASEGETSLLYFGGRLSHVVNKRPVAGEFRVQQQFGGAYTLLDAPPAGALALAQRTLAAIDAPLLYARIDTVPDATGAWVLMEAELIEPDFYLGVDPQRGVGFARALRASL
jgi:glutathione synthase/RimK-type ligase-like ATP-grasp enzyme